MGNAGHYADFDRSIRFWGLIPFLLGSLALAGYFTHNLIFAGGFATYAPMAVSTAISSIGFGLVMLTWSLRRKSVLFRGIMLAIVIILASYGLAKFTEFLFGVRLTLDYLVLDDDVRVEMAKVNSMSPFTGLLLFILGFSMAVLLNRKKGMITVNLTAFLGTFVSITGFITSLGYLEGKPLLYEGSAIPISFPASLSIFFLGTGTVAMAGNHSLILKYFTGNSTSAKLLRNLVPLILSAVLAEVLLEDLLTRFIDVYTPLLVAVISVLLIIITVVIAVRIARVIFRDAENAEQQRLKAEDALRKSEELHRLILQNMGEGVGIVDTQERFIFANPAAEILFGVAKGGLLHRNLFDFIDQKMVPFIRSETNKRSLDESSTYELEILTPSGKSKVLMVTATPQFNENGQFSGTFGIFRDMTERKALLESLRQSEETYRKLAQELQALNATKDKFFSIIAHDLKNPFNILFGFSRMLLEDIREKEFDSAAKIGQKIVDVSQTTYKLLENLLTWSQLQIGKMTLRKETFILNELLVPELKILEEMAEQKGIAFKNEVRKTLLLDADKEMVAAVIRNFVTNAIKFTMPGGTVVLDAIQENGHSIISITDTGTGLSEKEIASLFDISKTQSKTGTSSEKGTGLGLVLCNEFAHLHGGYIEVKSEPGKGSKFSIFLPSR
jgi:PAS domain S-box-containing protein